MQNVRRWIELVRNLPKDLQVDSDLVDALKTRDSWRVVEWLKRKRDEAAGAVADLSESHPSLAQLAKRRRTRPDPLETSYQEWKRVGEEDEAVLEKSGFTEDELDWFEAEFAERRQRQRLLENRLEWAEELQAAELRSK